MEVAILTDHEKVDLVISNLKRVNGSNKKLAKMGKGQTGLKSS